MKKVEWFCDHCGEKTGWLRRITGTRFMWGWWSFDLCEPCAEKLKAWVKNREVKP